jgi:hypothetical protein
MHMRASDLCRHCTIAGVVLTVDDQVVFVDHSPFCSRGRGDREFYGRAEKPIYFAVDTVTPVEIVDSIPTDAQRWTLMPAGVG